MRRSASLPDGGLEVEEFDFHGVFAVWDELYEADAAVFDVEMGHVFEGHLQQEGDHDADDAAMAKNGDFAVRVGVGDVQEAFAHTGLEAVDVFAVGDAVALDDFQPVEGADAEVGLHLVPAVAGPVAEVHLAQAGHELGLHGALGGEGGEGLLHAEHGAGVEGIEVGVFEPGGDGFAVLDAEGGEAHVDAGAAEDLVVLFLHLAVADEVDLHGVQTKQYSGAFVVEFEGGRSGRRVAVRTGSAGF
jgi:hypothetical protein